jgi:putrescine aminotransferase
VQRICDQHGVLLVSDEVICGFGRTGAWFGSQTLGFKPDLMTFAKGVTSGYVPLGGVMVGERIAKVLIERGGEFEHGYTYSGHPVACAVGLANVKLIRDQKLVEHVHDDVGPYLAQKYAELGQHELVGDASSCGLMAALQLVKDKTTMTPFDPQLEVGMVCRGHCFGNGLVMRAVGDRMIIAPPLVITRAQVDELFDLIRRCLDLTLADVHARGWLTA